MRTTLDPTRTARVLDTLGDANLAWKALYPGDSPARQPLHTVYGGAQLFKATTTKRLGEIALRLLREHAPDFATFARALGTPGHESLPRDPEGAAALAAQIEVDPTKAKRDDPTAWLAHAVYTRVVRKLETEPVEDFRIDFEDGFGIRPDPEEDAAAETTAREVAKGMKEGILPPFLGIRVKTLSEELKRRSIRTLDVFVSTLVAETGGKLPENFVITLPKIPIPEQVEAFVALLGDLEDANGLARGTLKIELMIELTQSILDPEGRSTLPRLLRAARGRCTGAHFGTYDYTASANVTAAYQAMDHAACDFAKHMMTVAYAGTGIFLSDGATNVMPVGPHAGGDLTAAQKAENTAVVHRAWKLAYDQTRHSLRNGFYQGWDLHPGQLPVRYAACFGFFLEGLDAASERLRNFVTKAGQATLVGDVFDDAATGQGLLNYFLRARNSGAITDEEALATGLTPEEMMTRSFVAILESRKAKTA